MPNIYDKRIYGTGPQVSTSCTTYLKDYTL